MATLDEVIEANKDKTVTITVAQLEDFHSDAFHAGMSTSKYSPNINGDRMRDFISTEIFKAVRKIPYLRS